MKELFDGAVKFKQDDFRHFKDLYQNLRSKQRPHTLFITCVDSRVDPNLITNSKPGDLYVVRNMGNLIPPYNNFGGYLSTTSAIEYALLVLKVKNIIICGHSNCGACAAIYNDKSLYEKAPHIEQWLDLLSPIKNKVLSLKPRSKLKRMWLTEQLNIREQLENLLTYPFIQEKLERGRIKIYGWYYIIPSGEIFNYNFKTKDFELIT